MARRSSLTLGVTGVALLGACNALWGIDPAKDLPADAGAGGDAAGGEAGLAVGRHSGGLNAQAGENELPRGGSGQTAQESGGGPAAQGGAPSVPPVGGQGDSPGGTTSLGRSGGAPEGASTSSVAGAPGGSLSTWTGGRGGEPSDGGWPSTGGSPDAGAPTDPPDTAGVPGSAGSPVLVERRATSIAVGAYHTCAVVEGTVWCWGSDEYGQLGNGSDPATASPAAVVGLTDAVDVVAGVDHTCARLADGTVQCWGCNGYGQLGNPDGGASETAVPMAVSDIVQLAAGEYHTCGITSGGEVYCWGSNTMAQLGRADTSGTEPAMVEGVNGAARVVDAGRQTTCVLLDDASVSCWGDEQPSPQPLDGAVNASAISDGGYHLCILDGYGTPSCMGADDFGQLGNGNEVGSTESLVPVDALEGLLRIEAGHTHTCAICSCESLYCWGSNGSRQLGLGDDSSRQSPELVPGIPAVRDVATGWEHTCVLSTEGKVLCWGNNTAGQAGPTLDNPSGPFEIVFP